MLHLNPYTLMVNGKEEPSHYIVAVATEEACRKRGYMAALLKTALQDMYQAGEPFTFLMPAAEAIYLPHGFSTVYEQEQGYFRERRTFLTLDRKKGPSGGCSGHCGCGGGGPEGTL